MDKKVNLIEIREAISDYMYSEGCDCCRNIEAHGIHGKRIAKLLNVEMFGDESGYDFAKYRTWK